jgi:hypothetical protein
MDIRKTSSIILILFLAALQLQAQQRMVIEAETGTISTGSKVDTKYAGFTGTGFVDTKNEVGAFIEITFSVKKGGQDTVTVVYAMEKIDDRSAKVIVNNGVVIDSMGFPSTGSYTAWKPSSAIVPLNVGMNTLRLEARSINGLSNIDRFEISDEQGAMQYLLATSILGKGTITRSPNAQFYDAGTSVTLTVVPDAASVSVFTGWSGDLFGTEMQKIIVINEAKNVTASFRSTVHGTFYLSPNGSDSLGDGSFTKPFFSVQKAANLAEAGDTIFLRGGQYLYTNRINLNNGGTATDYIHLRSYKAERAVLDFSGMTDDDFNQGFRLTGSYWHFYGFDVKGAGDNGLLIERDKPIGATYDDIKNNTDQAHNNIIELCNFYENRDSGIQLKNLAANNSIINCDSYYNRDATDGDADGFAPKLTVGSGNYFYGCRAWQNSDDGWDLYLKAQEDGFPQDMVTTMENCWAFNNGYLKDGNQSTGNGNGFKLGGSAGKDQRHDAVLKRCLSFDNLQKGFDQNSNVGNMTLINCTGFSKALLTNSSHFTYNIDGGILAAGKQLIHTNNISIGDGLLRKESKWAECKMANGVQTTSDYFTVESDFVSTDTAGVRGPRKADGSLPDVGFMKLKTGNTKLIDKGTTVAGIAFNGIAPDLGAFETGIAASSIRPQLNPKYFTLEQNFPNPFNPETSISFTVPQTADVVLTVIDVLGRKCAELVNSSVAAGTHSILWNARGFSSGMYLYRLTVNGVSVTKKMTILQ